MKTIGYSQFIRLKPPPALSLAILVSIKKLTANILIFWIAPT